MTDNPHLIKRGELDVIQIDNASCSAEVSLYGGHVLQWQPSGQKPVLWMSDNASYDGKAALRGGIPVCWPWFGPVEGKGRHGLVRTRTWELSDFSDEGDATSVELSLLLPDHVNPWPHPSRVVLKLVFGEQLSQELVISNTTEKPQCHSFALHNYFRISNPAAVTVPLLKNCLFEDKLTDQQQQLEDRDQHPSGYFGPLDRVYQSQEAVEIIDPEWHRVIRIEKQNAQQWVVWNPGDEARQIPDIHPAGEQQFLCVETANTADMVVPPGETQTISQTITVESK